MVKKFRVEISETYRCYVDVEALNEVDAQATVEKQVVDGDIVVLDNYSYMDRGIVVVRPLS